jgi:hypothetical protein
MLSNRGRDRLRADEVHCGSTKGPLSELKADATLPRFSDLRVRSCRPNLAAKNEQL